jgi:hypothetical protein
MKAIVNDNILKLFMSFILPAKVVAKPLSTRKGGKLW